MVCQVFCLPEFFCWIVKAGPPKCPHSMNTTKMTITERNQKLYDLREKMHKLETQLAWVKQEIWIVNDQYDRQDLNLFEEMFGTDVTYTETAYDTPMAEEVYGG